jgi:two-component system cell cycle sensor histidine kinase/response regulator CckA
VHQVDNSASLREENAQLRAEVDALRQEQELTRRAIAQADAVPYVLDYTTGRYSFIGEGIEELTGWPANEFEPAMWRSIIVESIGQGEQTGLTALEAGERTRAGEFVRWRYDLLIRRRDGELRWIADGSIELFGPDGTSTGSIGLLQDIDDRKRAEHERERHQQEVKLLETQRLESLSILAGGIAHDFNNLLVAILGNAGLATPLSEPGSMLRSSLEAITTASERASELTAQMLAFSGKGIFVVAPLDLSAAVEEASRPLEEIRARQVDVRYALARDLPPVDADAEQIRQMLTNLLMNAAEAIGGGSGTIDVSTAHVELARDELAAFDPFYSTKFPGRGLGLAAVLGIVRGHRGAIAIESGPGSGTAIRIAFPAAAASA